MCFEEFSQLGFVNECCEHTHEPIFRSISKGPFCPLHLQSDQSFAPEHLGSHPPSLLVCFFLLLFACHVLLMDLIIGCTHLTCHHHGSKYFITLEQFHHMSLIHSVVTISSPMVWSSFFSPENFCCYFDPKELDFFF